MDDINSDYMSIEEIKTPMLIYLEGNIACGKSTIMQQYAKYVNVDILCEPIELWENFHGSNLLELRYINRKQFDFLFQTMVCFSRLEQMNEFHQNNSVKIMERSLYSSFEVFVEHSKTVMDMDDLEYKMLKYMFEVSKKGALDKMTRPDLIIYLKTDSDVCLSRMNNRNRTAEKTVPLDVIEGLHIAHENWLLNESKVPCPIIVLDGNLDKSEWNVQTSKINKKILEIANIKRKKINSQEDTLTSSETPITYNTTITI
jgi:deoxyadenosine/deoxycytidine kinase